MTHLIEEKRMIMGEAARICIYPKKKRKFRFNISASSLLRFNNNNQHRFNNKQQEIQTNSDSSLLISNNSYSINKDKIKPKSIHSHVAAAKKNIVAVHVAAVHVTAVQPIAAVKPIVATARDLEPITVSCQFLLHRSVFMGLGREEKKG
jgi:hypothetical protein